MKSTAMMGLILVLLGVAVLVYQGITYSTRDIVLHLGPIQATNETTMPLPPLVGARHSFAAPVLLVAAGNGPANPPSGR